MIATCLPSMQEASKAPKVDLKEAPPASPTSALPPSGAMPPWEREPAPEMGEAEGKARGEEGTGLGSKRTTNPPDVCGVVRRRQ